MKKSILLSRHKAKSWHPCSHCMCTSSKRTSASSILCFVYQLSCSKLMLTTSLSTHSRSASNLKGSTLSEITCWRWLTKVSLSRPMPATRLRVMVSSWQKHYWLKGKSMRECSSLPNCWPLTWTLTSQLFSTKRSTENCKPSPQTRSRAWSTQYKPYPSL